MCGIFGAFGEYDTQKLKTLALLNEARGKDSYGYFNGTHILKEAIPIRESIQHEFLNIKKPYILGHTRFATYGSVKRENAHPFHYGDIVGAHNGCVTNLIELKVKYRKDFEVDSQAIFWGLNESGLESLKDVEAYWGLWFVDLKTPDDVYLMNHAHTLALGREGNAIYFASSSRDLNAIGIKTWDLKPDVLYKVSSKDMTISNTKVEGLKPYGSAYDWRTTGEEWDGWNKYAKTRYKKKKIVSETDHIDNAIDKLRQKANKGDLTDQEWQDLLELEEVRNWGQM